MLRLEVEEGVALSPLTLADADELFLRIAKDRDDLARWLPWARGATLAGTRAFIEGAQARLEAGDGFDLAIRERGRIVGGIGLHHIDPLNHATSLGYWLAASARGRGLITRSCHAVLAHAFRDMGLHRVEIRVAPDNAASLAVVHRLGGKEEGRLREAALLEDRWHDLLVFGILSHEWLRS